MKEITNLTIHTKEYAGIGSRETPPNVIRLMKMIGQVLAKNGLILRSGGADGADAAFESGCDQAEGQKEIFLPWKGFNQNNSPLTKPSMAAELLASEIHPRWKACSPGAQKLHARNCHQILGENLKHPVAFVVFWAKTIGNNVNGGTATAVNLAKSKNIPCFNLNDISTFENFKTFCEENI